MSPIDRRRFLHVSAALAGGALLAPPVEGLLALSQRAVAGGVPEPVRAGPGEGGYGPLRQAGMELDLPSGFAYSTLGVAGSRMSDGDTTPYAHDGMAAFALPSGNIRLIRNHEVIGVHRRPAGRDPSRAYDRKAGGGTTSLEVRPDGERAVVRDFVSLGGTIVNCAGGPVPWGAWLTCEESTLGPETGYEKPHGYVFEVPVRAETQVPAEPLTALGRFVHEAVAVDPRSGIVYETEDLLYSPRLGRAGSGFYRFIPQTPGALRDGGRLEMLAVAGRPNYHTLVGQRVGAALPVNWVPIDDPDPPSAAVDASAVFRQGHARGAAVFQRLEGCWYAEGAVYFSATSGGDARMGQVWQYVPEGGDGGRLTLIFESTGGDVLNRPDNLCVSPRGGIAICEDGSGHSYVRGLTRDGKIFDVARYRPSDTEFAGACFSPDGRTLFVNAQGSRAGSADPGRTFAIWGPWEDGAL